MRTRIGAHLGQASYTVINPDLNDADVGWMFFYDITHPKNPKSLEVARFLPNKGEFVECIWQVALTVQDQLLLHLAIDYVDVRLPGEEGDVEPIEGGRTVYEILRRQARISEDTTSAVYRQTKKMWPTTRMGVSTLLDEYFSRKEKHFT